MLINASGNSNNVIEMIVDETAIKMLIKLTKLVNQRRIGPSHKERTVRATRNNLHNATVAFHLLSLMDG